MKKSKGIEIYTGSAGLPYWTSFQKQADALDGVEGPVALDSAKKVFELSRRKADVVFVSGYKKPKN